MSAGVTFAVFAGFGGFATDELVEVAALAAGRFFLVDQRQICFVKLLKEFLPGDLLEVFILGIRRAREFDSNDAGGVLRLC
jgi:hypothetical protein